MDLPDDKRARELADPRPLREQDRMAEIERINEQRRKCEHDFQRTGYSMGCVTYECSKCGEFDEKDVS